MSGQATVTIGDKQWTVEVATTLTELSTGLSNRDSIAANTGMLFDLRSVSKSIDINMSEMLFPLDIIFVSEAGGVVGVASNAQPGTPVYLRNTDLPGARYFMEVNAGEADGIVVGDSVAITGYTASTQIDITSLMNMMMMIMIMSMMFKVMGGVSVGKAAVSTGKELGEAAWETGGAVVSAGKQIGKTAKEIGGEVKETLWE